MPKLLVAEGPAQGALGPALRGGALEVDTVADGESAVRAIAAGDYDLLVADLVLPGIDGLETCRRVKRNPERRHVPVLLRTEDPLPETLLAALKAGADGFLPRGAPAAESRRRIEQALQRRSWLTAESGALNLEFLTRAFGVRPDQPQLVEVLLQAVEELVRVGQRHEKEISVRKRAEQELLESEARRQAVFNAALDSIVVVDQEGKIIELNFAAQRSLATSSEAAAGRELAELFVPEPNRARFRRNLARFTAAGEMGSLLGRRLELMLVRTDGEQFLAEVAIQPFPLKGDAVFAIFLHDITDRKRAEKKLAAYAEELARSNRDLEQFAYAASHDLQEPLRLVASYCELLKRRHGGQLGQEGQEFVTYALEGTQRMQQLIDGLLEYARVGSRSQSLEPTDVNEVVRDVLANLELVLTETGARVTFDKLPTLPADRTQLVQLFQNLIANAVKFRAERPPRVVIQTLRRGEMWHFAVIDNGIGIDPRHAEKVFEIFRRLHSRQEYPGTGIGLALCKRIVERHGGQIWLKSQPGKGSAFHFTLPAGLPRGAGGNP
jgi:PAS domain S-box-containing protein